MYSSAQLQSAFAELSAGMFSNPHSHLHSEQGGENASTTAKVERVRRQAMRFFSASEEEYELVFTSGATAALKLVGECFPWQDGSSFAYSMDSHTSVLGIRGYATRHGASTRCIPLDEMKRLEEERRRTTSDDDADSPVSLFAFPAECNFSGVRHSLSLVDKIQSGALTADKMKQKWFVLLDAAKYVSTHRLDLSKCKPDFVVLSFYKMFGYPTGLGALLAKKSALKALRKGYYGGGTVQSILASQNLVIPRGMAQGNEHQSAARFADGTQSFLSIISLRHGFDQLEKLGMHKIEAHTSSLTRLLYATLSTMKHWNDRPVCEIYGNHEDLTDAKGPIVACNFFRPEGSYVGYSEVSKLAAIHNIQLRTGCFCNPGACQSYLRLRDEDLLAGIEAGHVCGDDMDLLNGLPTGAVRLSIGYMTSYEDIVAFTDFVIKYFVSTTEPIRDTASSSITHAEEDSNKQVHLRKITLFPIKSCSGMTVDAWPVGSRGLLFDREWAIVEVATNKALSLKELPELCFIRPEVDLKQQTLTISFQSPSAAASSTPESFVLPLTHADTRMRSKDAADDTPRDMRVCAGACKGRDVGEDVSQWLSTRLNRQCALVRVAPTHLRDSQASRPKRDSSRKISSPTSELSSSSSNDGASSKIGFANQAQYLLISRASIANLNAALQAADDSLAVDEDAFRANLIVDGCEAFDEDTWTRLHIGSGDNTSTSSCDSIGDEGVTFDVSGPCSRCAMINVDPKTGAFHRAPLQTLSKYRRERSSVFFGQFLTRRPSSSSSPSAASIKWLHVGDAIAWLK